MNHKIKKHLRCLLTKEELSEKQRDLAVKIAELRTKEDDKKSIVSQLSSELNALKAETNALATLINSGFEYRTVDCEIKYDFDKDKKTTVRTDTGEIIEETKIPDEEKQINAFDETL